MGWLKNLPDILTVQLKVSLVVLWFKGWFELLFVGRVSWC